MTVIWNGTRQEAEELMQALKNQCECRFGIMGESLGRCAGHKALAEDQLWLDHLVFLKRLGYKRLELEV